MYVFHLFPHRAVYDLYVKVNDDRIILDKTVADQVNLWRSSKGFTDKLVPNHACSGETCSYHMIGDVYVCEKTGHVHGINSKSNY